MNGGIKHKQIERFSVLWTKPDSPHAYDEEFEGDGSLPSGWVESFTPSGSIDPYTVFNTGVPKRSINDWRTSCYAIQAPNHSAQYELSRAITVPTDFFIWYRASYSLRYGDSTGNDGTIGLILGASSGDLIDYNNYVMLLLREADAGDPTQIQVQKAVGGSFSSLRETVDRSSTGTGQMYEYAGIQKIGNDYHFWAFSDNGQMFHLVSTTAAITPDRVCLFFKNANTAGPGNTIITVDFVRFKESAVFLPGFGN